MVKFCLLVITILTVICTSSLYALTAEYAAYRGAEFFSRADYAKAETYFVIALESARKEADLLKENKILLNLAALEIHALRFTSADSLLHLIHTESLDPIRHYYNLIAIETYQGLGTCLENPIVQNIESTATSDDAIITRSKLILAECYIAQELYAPALKIISDAEKSLDDSGHLLFVKGVLSFQQKNFSSSQTHFSEALAIAQKKHRFYRIGVLLYHLGLVAEMQSYHEEAQKLYARAFSVFTKIELDNWSSRVHKKIK